MKKINKSLLTVGAFACLSACYSVSNAAILNINLKKSDNSGYENALVTYKIPGYSYYALLGQTDQNGNIDAKVHELPALGEYTLEIYTGNSLIRDTFVISDMSDTININLQSVNKVVKFTNSADVPYAGETVRVRNEKSFNFEDLVTNSNGVASFEVFDNAKFWIDIWKNGQAFSRIFDSNTGDTMFLHTVAANIHWPHSLTHSGDYGFSYELTGNSPIKTIEVLPSVVKMKFTSESNSVPVTNDYSLTVPYDAHVKSFDYTPVQFRVHKADGTLATESFPLTYSFLGESELSLNSNGNGTAMVVIEGNVTSRRLIGNAYKFGKNKNDRNSALTIAGKNNLLDFNLASLTFNTLASGAAKTINYRLPAQTGYYTFIAGQTNTPLEIELFPTTYNFQAEYNSTIKTNYAYPVGAGTNSHDYILNKVTVKYEDANANPLDGGTATRVGSNVALGTTDASGEAVYYRFVTGTTTETLKFNDAARRFNITQQQFNLTEGLDGVLTFVNPNVTAPVPVSDLLTLNANVNVYPNPATDFIQVKMNAAHGEVYIYNTVGQLVYNNANVANNETISVSSLSTGVYNVVIVSNDKKETVRIVKN